ncbi:autophagy protein 6 [Skeletonema marinoi]|uniref:Autophagy protein 6 n=1 Tax=Skeletonema marinoi TaxID=267567 RepID=A0AAD8XZH8_9STRA|nr:autophagy protein 6 [Skeletonema marinoi]
MASDLDNTRRCGIPLVNTKPSDSDQEVVCSESGAAPSLPQHIHHSRTHSFPNVRHEKKSAMATINGLDGELSGLQKAATKTALPPSFNRGVVATEKEEDEQYLHWVFHRHVGFTAHARNNSKTNHMQKASNGHIDKHHHPQSTMALAADQISSSSSAADIIEATKLSERQHLLEELQSIRQQRDHLRQNVFPTLHRHHDELNFRHMTAQQSYQYASSSLQSTRTQRIWTEKEYQQACRWHAFNDMFFIWHRGPFGTISGIRLGRSAVTMVGLVKKCAGSGSSASGQSASATSTSVFSWGTSEHALSNQETNATQSLPHTATSNNNNIHPSNVDPEKLVVPWSEINSALGQIVLLLYTLQNTPFSGISFRKYVLQPCGSFSKIGLLKGNAAQTASSPQRPKNERRRITALTAYLDTDNNPSATKPDDSTRIHSKPIFSPRAAPLPHEVTWYNLHHYEENGSILSLGYYARRNFNTALEALLFCIAETCLVVEKRDMALAAPYTMRVDGLVVGKDAYLEGSNTKSDGEATVGGLPFSYDPGDGERWTLACKYLLTNLKWVMAYAVKQSSV